MQYYRKTSVREQARERDRQRRAEGPQGPSGRGPSGPSGPRPPRGPGSSRPNWGKRPRKRRVRVKKRFYFFVAAFLLVLGLIGFGIASLARAVFAGYYVVDYGMIESTNKVSALLLRDEMVVRSEGYGTVQYVAADLQDVQAGDAVLDFYSSGYTKDIQTELSQVNARIEQQQQNALYAALESIVDQELERYQDQIEQKTQQIRQALAGEGDLLQLYQELKSLMESKQAYLEQTATAQADTTLTQLYATRSQLLSRIQGWRSAYTAPMDGRVSYSFDGFEAYLTTEVLDLLSAQNVRELLRNEDPEQPAELRSQQNLYRIVDADHWYAIILTTDTNWTIGVGETCALYFEGYEDRTFQATVNAMSGSQTELMVVLEMNEDIGPLINARKLTAVIGGRVEGMRVPLSAVSVSGEQQGVYLYETGEFVPVRVIGHDSKYALVMPVEDGALQKDMRIRK